MTAQHGGKRQGAGRKPGVATKKTREVAERAATEGITPLEYILSVMRNPANEPAQRLDAAKAAAPYIHPRLTPVAAEAPKAEESQAPAPVDHPLSGSVVAFKRSLNGHGLNGKAGNGHG
jgi:hypothetical protein